MLTVLCVLFTWILLSGSGLEYKNRHERTRYVSGRNQIYSSGHYRNHDPSLSTIHLIHFWERPLQKLESSMNIPKTVTSRPLFSWDLPEKSDRTASILETSNTTVIGESSLQQRNSLANPSFYDYNSGLSKKTKKFSNRKKSVSRYSQQKKDEDERQIKRRKANDKRKLKMTQKEITGKINEVGIKKKLLKKGRLKNRTLLKTKKPIVETTKAEMTPKPPCEVMEEKCEHMCQNINGMAVCSCFSGFTAIGTKCTDVDECSINNGNCNGICINTVGSRECICSPGYRLVEGVCLDVNECLLRNGHGPCQDKCTNTIGSYQCSCESLQDTELSSDKHTCSHINKCNPQSAGCSHSCFSVSDRIFCTCPDGFELGDNWKTCNDVDECLNPEEYSVKCEFGCINTMGSYKCAEENGTVTSTEILE